MRCIPGGPQRQNEEHGALRGSHRVQLPAQRRTGTTGDVGQLETQEDIQERDPCRPRLSTSQQTQDSLMVKVQAVESASPGSPNLGPAPRVLCDLEQVTPLLLSFLLFKMSIGTSLVAQWLGVHLPVQGTRVRARVREDPTCRGAAKPVRHNY